MRPLVVRNEEGESLGLYERPLSEEEMDHQVLHAYGLNPNAPFPRVEDFNVFIIEPMPTLRSSRLWKNQGSGRLRV